MIERHKVKSAAKKETGMPDKSAFLPLLRRVLFFQEKNNHAFIIGMMNFSTRM